MLKNVPKPAVPKLHMVQNHADRKLKKILKQLEESEVESILGEQNDIMLTKQTQ